MTEVAAEKEFAVIIRGRMPVGIVALAKQLMKDEAATNSVVANRLNTTVGKIHDIRNNRCFGYVDDEFKPTNDQVKEAINWLSRHKDGEEAVADLIEMLQNMDTATEDEAKAFLEKRAGARTKSEPKVDPETGEPIKRKRGRKAKEKAEAVQDVPDTSADDTSVDDLLN